MAAGGKLIMGCRTGYKDIYGRCVMDYLPGMASRLSGTDVPEYSFAAPDEGKITADWEGSALEAAVFNDILSPAGDNAQILAVRVKEGKKYLFVLNYLARPAKITLTVPVQDLWTGKTLSGEWELESYGTIICRLPESSGR